MVQLYSHSTKWNKDTVIILHINSSRGIFLLCYGDKDTLCTEYEIQMTISQLIFTHKNISKAIWENDIPTLQIGRKIL